MARFATAILLLAVASPAVADQRLEPAFANTIVSTYPDGRTAKLWLERDGAYRGQSRKGTGRRGPASGLSAAWSLVERGEWQ